MHERRATPAPSPLAANGLVAVLAAGLLFGCGGGVSPIRTAFNRGVYHFSHGRYDQAIHEYRSALRTDPEDKQARFNLALALEAKARQTEGAERKRLRKEAAAAYRKVIDQDSDHLRANVNLATLTAERGDVTAAKKRLRRVADAHPHSALPWTALAVVQKREGKTERAIKTLRKAVDRDAASVRANMLLGDLLADVDKLQEAVDAYKQALKTDSSDLATLISLGRTQRRLGRLPDAAATLRQALLIDPDSWSAHLQLAKVRRRQKRYAEAARHYRRARALDHQRPTDRSRPDYAGRLRKIYQALLAQTKSETNQP